MHDREESADGQADASSDTWAGGKEATRQEGRCHEGDDPDDQDGSVRQRHHADLGSGSKGVDDHHRIPADRLHDREKAVLSLDEGRYRAPGNGCRSQDEPCRENRQVRQEDLERPLSLGPDRHGAAIEDDGHEQRDRDFLPE